MKQQKMKQQKESLKNKSLKNLKSSQRPFYFLISYFPLDLTALKVK
jgi:hypothetical protein